MIKKFRKFLCRLGFHSWKLHSEDVFIDSNYAIIFFKECQVCGERRYL